MNFIDTLLALINRNGITKNKLLVDLKLGKNSFVDWKKNGNIPSGETLSKIATYFNVSTDYLLGKGDTANNPSKDDEIKFALFGTTDIDDELYNDVKRLAKMQQQLKEEKRGK